MEFRSTFPNPGCETDIQKPFVELYDDSDWSDRGFMIDFPTATASTTPTTTPWKVSRTRFRPCDIAYPPGGDIAPTGISTSGAATWI